MMEHDFLPALVVLFSTLCLSQAARLAGCICGQFQPLQQNTEGNRSGVFSSLYKDAMQLSQCQLLLCCIYHCMPTVA